MKGAFSDGTLTLYKQKGNVQIDMMSQSNPDGWEYFDIENMPTDFEEGDVIKLHSLIEGISSGIDTTSKTYADTIWPEIKIPGGTQMYVCGTPVCAYWDDTFDRGCTTFIYRVYGSDMWNGFDSDSALILRTFVVSGSAVSYDQHGIDRSMIMNYDYFRGIERKIQ